MRVRRWIAMIDFFAHREMFKNVKIVNAHPTAYCAVIECRKFRAHGMLPKYIYRKSPPLPKSQDASPA